MKHTILGVLISLTSLGFCYEQFNLEHTYDERVPFDSAPFDFGRVHLENSGEKYYIVNETTNAGQRTYQLRLYNADHTLWKTINIPSPWVSHLSETLINPDAQLEIISGNTIINESGDTLLKSNSSNWAGSWQLRRLPGLPDKLTTQISGSFP